MALWNRPHVVIGIYLNCWYEIPFQSQVLNTLN